MFFFATLIPKIGSPDILKEAMTMKLMRNGAVMLALLAATGAGAASTVVQGGGVSNSPRGELVIPDALGEEIKTFLAGGAGATADQIKARTQALYEYILEHGEEFGRSPYAVIRAGLRDPEVRSAGVGESVLAVSSGGAGPCGPGNQNSQCANAFCQLNQACGPVELIGCCLKPYDPICLTVCAFNSLICLANSSYQYAACKLDESGCGGSFSSNAARNGGNACTVVAGNQLDCSSSNQFRIGLNFSRTGYGFNLNFNDFTQNNLVYRVVISKLGEPFLNLANAGGGQVIYDSSQGILSACAAGGDDYTAYVSFPVDQPSAENPVPRLSDSILIKVDVIGFPACNDPTGSLSPGSGYTYSITCTN